MELQACRSAAPEECPKAAPLRRDDQGQKKRGFSTTTVQRPDTAPGAHLQTLEHSTSTYPPFLYLFRETSGSLNGQPWDSRCEPDPFRSGLFTPYLLIITHSHCSPHLNNEGTLLAGDQDFKTGTQEV